MRHDGPRENVKQNGRPPAKGPGSRFDRTKIPPHGAYIDMWYLIRKTSTHWGYALRKDSPAAIAKLLLSRRVAREPAGRKCLMAGERGKCPRLGMQGACGKDQPLASIPLSRMGMYGENWAMSAVTGAQAQRGPVGPARSLPLKERMWKVPQLRRLRLFCSSQDRLADAKWSSRKVRLDAGGPDGKGAGRLFEPCRRGILN